MPPRRRVALARSKSWLCIENIDPSFARVLPNATNGLISPNGYETPERILSSLEHIFGLLKKYLTEL